jgi:hypothetical protein
MNSALLERDFCVQKLDAVLALIKKLLDSEFPHPDTKAAFQQLELVYKDEVSRLSSINTKASHDTVLGYCLNANVRIAQLTQFLGMLVRSSNLRNAFEMFFPIKVLARELLTPSKSKLVLTSEWNFSPFTYPISPDELPEFIFIGLPASESQNPLILPLAGHELGHVVWRRKGVQNKFEPEIKTHLIQLYRNNWDDVRDTFFDGNEISVGKLETDFFLRRIWGQSVELANRQIEELFCDFVGIYVFGEAFLHSFRYLVAPSLGRQRNLTYPSLRKRAECMLFAARHHGIETIQGFIESFQEQEPKMSKQMQFILRLSDEATANLYPKLLDLVEKNHGDAHLFSVGAANLERVRTNLQNLIPADHIDSIAVIVNAGWRVRLAIDKWDILAGEADYKKRRQEKMRVLNEILLKSFEVYEFRKRLSQHAT